MMSNARIDELIREFDHYDGRNRLAALEEALTLREEITPRLIRILEEVADDPVRCVLEDRDAHVCAAVLLAHFQEPAAHQPIIRAFCIPEDQREFLWGDMVTETLAALLLQTCNRDLSSIRELILDRGTPEYVRSSAVDALTFAVVRDMVSREKVIAFLSGLFTGDEAEEDSNFWNNLVCALSDLHPEESMAVIRQAYEEGLVDPTYVDMPSVEQDLVRDREEVLDRLRAVVEKRIPEDVYDYLSNFAGYREDDDELGFLQPSPVDCTQKSQKKRKKKNRARNKQAKKARKKNRR